MRITPVYQSINPKYHPDSEIGYFFMNTFAEALKNNECSDTVNIATIVINNPYYCSESELNMINDSEIKQIKLEYDGLIINSNSENIWYLIFNKSQIKIIGEQKCQN